MCRRERNYSVIYFGSRLNIRSQQQLSKLVCRLQRRQCGGTDSLELEKGKIPVSDTTLVGDTDVVGGKGDINGGGTLTDDDSVILPRRSIIKSEAPN